MTTVHPPHPPSFTVRTHPTPHIYLQRVQLVGCFLPPCLLVPLIANDVPHIKQTLDGVCLTSAGRALQHPCNEQAFVDL